MNNLCASGSQTFEEIQITVPWGHISGKWWGSKDVQPILALHGWQDNAGTFDNLAPLLLSRGHSILCIDLPGHGFSSPFNEGQHYYMFWDGIHLIRRIVKHFNWNKITIMGHSLGGGMAFLYAATYPNDVEKMIQFDIVSPSIRSPSTMINLINELIDVYLECESISIDQQPSYEYEEIIDFVEQALGGVLPRVFCEILMKRGMKPASHKPGHYVFTRDPRLKFAALGFITADQAMQFASRIKCEVLNIKLSHGLENDTPEKFSRFLDVMEQNVKRLERHSFEGAHYFHLTDADKIIDIVNDFLIS